MLSQEVPFEKIPIDRESISQNDLNISNKIRSNIFTWHGQFSPQFVEVLLKKFSDKNDVVLDPFVGSGTTLNEAASLSEQAIGVELNASAYHLAKTYELINKSFLERCEIVGIIDEIIFGISKTDEILSNLLNGIENSSLNEVSDLLRTLIILLDLFKNDVSISLLIKKWMELKQIVITLPYSTKDIEVIRGDARSLNLNSNQATLLVTSPPYINVFNYHQNYRKSTEALGYDVLKIARNEIGSNRKNRNNRLLTVIQYCIDMALSFKEVIRVCSNQSRLIYVIGRESKVLGFSFCNSRFIYEIASEIFNLPIVLRQERVFKNRFGQNIYEDILHFENIKLNNNLNDETIKNKAREIAIRALNEKAQSKLNNPKTRFIYEAIDKAYEVNQSM